ncbi:MAG: type II toxin-antitoxin system VapC family toxin [Promethearchaeota archaeon]|nr:MAG: type II toxin-antitoxin system VapC family toxin [Candidatus Lokiarchaeota archaeon]
MGMNLSIDANIFISVINQEENYESCKKILNAIEAKKLEGYISAIAISEILVGYFRNKEYDNAKRFSSYIKNHFHIVKVDLEIASKAARLRAEKEIKLPDALVIVSSQESDFLITLDSRIKNQNPKKILYPNELLEIIMTK